MQAHAHIEPLEWKPFSTLVSAKPRRQRVAAVFAMYSTQNLHSLQALSLVVTVSMLSYGDDGDDDDSGCDEDGVANLDGGLGFAQCCATVPSTEATKVLMNMALGGEDGDDGDVDHGDRWRRLRRGW